MFNFFFSGLKEKFSHRTYKKCKYKKKLGLVIITKKLILPSRFLFHIGFMILGGTEKRMGFIIIHLCVLVCVCVYNHPLVPSN